MAPIWSLNPVPPLCSLSSHANPLVQLKPEAYPRLFDGPSPYNPAEVNIYLALYENYPPMNIDVEFIKLKKAGEAEPPLPKKKKDENKPQEPYKFTMEHLALLETYQLDDRPLHQFPCVTTALAKFNTKNDPTGLRRKMFVKFVLEYERDKYPDVFTASVRRAAMWGLDPWMAPGSAFSNQTVCIGCRERFLTERRQTENGSPRFYFYTNWPKHMKSCSALNDLWLTAFFNHQRALRLTAMVGQSIPRKLVFADLMEDIRALAKDHREAALASNRGGTDAHKARSDMLKLSVRALFAVASYDTRVGEAVDLKVKALRAEESKVSTGKQRTRTEQCNV